MSSTANLMTPPALGAGVPARPARVRRQRNWSAVALFIPACLVVLSFVGGCLMVLRMSFNAWDPVQSMTPAWTLANYANLFTDSLEIHAMVTTLRISAITTVAALLLAYPVAVGISRARGMRTFLTFLLVTPMMTDVLVRTYGWMVMFGQNGLLNVGMQSLGLWDRPHRIMHTELAVVLELIHELLPFAVLPIVNVLQRIEPVLGEAAMNLKASPWRTFLHVTLPLSLPGILAGTVLTFALAMSAFVAPLVLGGGNVITVTVLMSQNMLTTLNWPMGSARSVLLVGVVMVLLIVYRRALVRPKGRP